MAITGLFLLPFEANTPSPFPVLSQHISRKSTAQPLPPFWLEYRLLVDTSSLLPGALDSRKRRSVQFLTLGQFPEKTYVLTDSADTAASSIIALPSGAPTHGFFTMVTAKMQPLWAPRNEHRVEKGTAVELNEGSLIVRVGELRTTAGQGSGRVRGTIIAVTDTSVVEDDEDVADRVITLRALLDSLFRGSGVNLTNAKLIHKSSQALKTDPEHTETVRLYAELLKVAAPVGQR